MSSNSVGNYCASKGWKSHPLDDESKQNLVRFSRPSGEDEKSAPKWMLVGDATIAEKSNNELGSNEAHQELMSSVIVATWEPTLYTSDEFVKMLMVVTSLAYLAKTDPAGLAAKTIPHAILGIFAALAKVLVGIKKKMGGDCQCREKSICTDCWRSRCLYRAAEQTCTFLMGSISIHRRGISASEIIDAANFITCMKMHIGLGFNVISSILFDKHVDPVLRMEMSDTVLYRQSGGVSWPYGLAEKAVSDAIDTISSNCGGIDQTFQQKMLCKDALQCALQTLHRLDRSRGSVGNRSIADQPGASLTMWTSIAEIVSSICQDAERLVPMYQEIQQAFDIWIASHLHGNNEYCHMVNVRLSYAEGDAATACKKLLPQTIATASHGSPQSSPSQIAIF
jgi:hypothetical protein